MKLQKIAIWYFLRPKAKSRDGLIGERSVRGRVQEANAFGHKNSLNAFSGYKVY